MTVCFVIVPVFRLAEILLHSNLACILASKKHHSFLCFIHVYTVIFILIILLETTCSIQWRYLQILYNGSYARPESISNLFSTRCYVLSFTVKKSSCLLSTYLWKTLCILLPYRIGNSCCWMIIMFLSRKILMQSTNI